ncbi:glycosyltransferase family 2 protein [Ferruginibacter albus]|uniref:glycosyltransferase family 2 protein n=1 Tax=Ferruginibacter albus TaxID=2875540 RepID=UPI001CC78C5D|nr:glycosyltransferase family 2 protein [Ferruginibacter albus]UAY52234.1 glycosyltransferase [Ferruginibacter albus]
MPQPVLSIITINYNNEPGLRKTIKSVFDQTFTDYEYIIIDGGSTDGSTVIIEEHQQRFSYTVSEKDNGIYDAINKGIAKAKGRYLLFLNSGDFLVNEKVLSIISKSLIQQQHDIVYGKAIVYGIVKYNPYPLHLLNILETGICHQSMFFKKELFDKAGLYDTSYKVVADICHIILCLVRYNATNFFIDTTIVEMERDGISTVSKSNNMQERQAFLNKEFPVIAADYLLLQQYHKRDYIRRGKNFLQRKLNSDKE